jgi:peptidyl-prolyl cis-trans isomerase SurA
LQQREVANRVTVTQQEVDDFLASQESQVSPNAEYRIAHILVSIPEAATTERIQAAKQKAKKILDELEQGADFAQTAIARSDGQQALQGGDLGWRKLAQIPSLFARLVDQMEIGQISEAIRSPSGFHIIKLMEKRSDETQHIVNQTKVRHILIKPDLILSGSEARKRIEQLKQRIEAGEDFAELATSHSADKGSASQGGDLGWVNPGVMVKPFEEAMNALPIGEISHPVQTQFGWHILQVLDRRQFDDTEEYRRNQAREAVRQRKIEPAMANWLRRIRDEAFVEVRL